MVNPVQGQGSLPPNDKSCPLFTSEDSRAGAAFRRGLAASDDDCDKREMTPSNPRFMDQPPASANFFKKKIVCFASGAAVSPASNQSVPVRKGLSTEQIAERKKEMALESVGIQGLNLKDLPEFQDDDAVVLSAVYNNPDALMFASERLKGDPYIINAANTAKEHQLEALRAAVKGSIISNGLNLKRYPQFQDDKTVVLWAVEQNSGAVNFASQRLKEDPDILKILQSRSK